MRDHKKLKAFELADELAVLTYQVTKKFPKDELYGLTSQMRRAAVSIASNIVEGSARESKSEYIRFLDIAFGSLKELEYQASLSNRLGYFSEKSYSGINEKVVETEKVLGTLLGTLKKGRKQ
jgi:four helix bundle protein